MDYNYFEVLELSIDDIQGKDEATIKDLVNAAHTKLYALTIGAYANVPRPDGLTQAQWQKVLNDAKETLLDPRKRQKHIADLMPEVESTQAPEYTERPEPESTQTPEYTERPEPEPTQAPEYTERPEPESTQTPKPTWTAWIAIYTGQLFIAICIWRTLFKDPDFWRLLGGAAISAIVIYFIVSVGSEDEDDGIIHDIINGKKTEFLLGVIILALLPIVALIEHVLFGSNSGQFTLFLLPLFIICALLFRIGFMESCAISTFNFFSDVCFWSPIKSIRDIEGWRGFIGIFLLSGPGLVLLYNYSIFLMGCIDRRRWGALIVIFAGALAGALVSSGIVDDFISSSYTSLDFFDAFFNFIFLLHFLLWLFPITLFVRTVIYRRLWAIIKKAIMIGIVILAHPFTEVISYHLLRNTYAFDDFWDEFCRRNLPLEIPSELVPSILILISYYTVGYIRYIRSVR